MNDYEILEEMKRRSKAKGLGLTDEMIEASLKSINKEIEGLSLADSIRKLHKMIQEEE